MRSTGTQGISASPLAGGWWAAQRVRRASLPRYARRPVCTQQAAGPGDSQSAPPGARGSAWLGAEQEQGPARLKLGLEPEAIVEASASLQAGAPVASVSRALFAVQPGRVATQALRARGGRGLSLPGTLLLFALTVAAAVWTGVRQRLQAVRDCKVCKGYGIQRCKLCSGSGKISWEGKMAHDEPCPMCLGRRYTKCTACGGHLSARAMFMHLDAPGDAQLMETLASLDQDGQGAAGADGKAQERRSKKRSQKALLEELDAYATERMTD